MALMFQRLARNYAKDGYFPTDAETIQRVLNALHRHLGKCASLTLVLVKG